MKKNSEQAKVLTDKELEGVSGGRTVLGYIGGLTLGTLGLADLKVGQVAKAEGHVLAAKTGIIIAK